MSISPASLAATLLSMHAAATQQAISAAMVKQEADAEASVVGLVERALEASKTGSPPPGQGLAVDLTV
ncbi:hypothetical protein [Enterovirga aerilata]|uniref:Motility protein n=1 Tax=Enterovirga aerilata TaxID=2730920 RepID=A0A849I2X1_9HYPH|nr:hypothetical protein [Enterovirga sp. DB1703]NNM71984.1 hypothetical protein [Enterovirga sp. DB1703]